MRLNYHFDSNIVTFISYLHKLQFPTVATHWVGAMVTRSHTSTSNCGSRDLSLDSLTVRFWFQLVVSIERHKHGSKLCPAEHETRLVLLINKERINERAGKETCRISGWFPPRFPLTLLFFIIREAFDKYACELCWRVLIAFEDNSQWERYLSHEIFNKLTVTAFITFIPEEMKTYF